MQIHRYLDLNEERNTIVCRNCRETLCDATENYREHAALRTRPLQEAGPAFVSAEQKLGEDKSLEFREFFCPNCAVLLQADFARSDDPILHDIEINVENLSVNE